MSVDVKAIDIVPCLCSLIQKSRFLFYFSSISNEDYKKINDNFRQLGEKELQKRKSEVVELVKVYQHLKYCGKCSQGYLDYKGKLVSNEAYCGTVPPEAFAKIRKNEEFLDSLLTKYEEKVKEEKQALL